MNSCAAFRAELTGGIRREDSCAVSGRFGLDFQGTPRPLSGGSLRSLMVYASFVKRLLAFGMDTGFARGSLQSCMHNHELERIVCGLVLSDLANPA